MAVKTIFQWLNNDSTADLNRRFSTAFHKGISVGGNVNPVSGELSVAVNAFEAMTENGLLMVSDTDYKFESIPLNQMTVLTIFGKWIQGDPSIIEYRMYEINAYNSLANKGDHVVFGTVTLGAVDTQVAPSAISYDIRDVFDRLGRSAFRGALITATDLPAANNREGDFYSVGGGGGLVEIYAWNGAVWINITNTLALQNQLNNHRNNAYIDEKHLTDAEKDAVLGTVGSPSGSNRFITNQDTRVPTLQEKAALVGSHGTASSTNRFITEEYPLAETNYLVYPLAPGTLSMIAITGKYVGKGGIGSANTYFALMEIGIDRGYINTNGLFPKVVDVYKNSLLTDKLDPLNDADVDGFYDGDLYITVDNVIDTGVRLAYQTKKLLSTIDKGFASRKGPSADFVSGEARQYIQDIKGRDYDALIPADEKNITLRSDLDGLVSYLGSNQKISIVAGKEDFDYFSSDDKLGPSFVQNENISPIYTFENSGLLNFSYDSLTGVVTYSGSPSLASVVVGNLFRDGLGNYFKITAKTINSVTIVDIVTNRTPISSPNTSVSTSADGSISANNNPRNIIGNEFKAHAHEIIRFDELKELEEFSIPEGRQAFGILQDNKRVNPRVVLYGSWENYADTETFEEYIRNTNGIGDIQITDYVSEVYLLCKPKVASPILNISLNNEQVSSNVDTSFGGAVSTNVSAQEGITFTKVLIKNGLDSSKLTTLNMRIQAATANNLVVYGLELVSFPSINSTVTNELFVEAGVAFKAAKLIKRSFNEIVSIPAVNKFGVNYQVVANRDANNLPIISVINTPVPEMDYFPSYPTSTSFSGAAITVTDPNAKIFKVNDLIQLIGTVKTEIRRLVSIVGNIYTFDAAPTAEVKQFRLLCSLGDDTPFASYNTYAAKYNILKDFQNGSKMDFSLNNSGSLANRYMVHKDGQTILGAKNAEASEEKNTLVIPQSTGSLDIGMFGPKLAIEFNNATSVIVQVSIDGSIFYSLTIPAGKVRKTIFSKGRNTFHEIHIKSSTSSFEVTDIILYTIDRGDYKESTLLATVDNVSPYAQQLATDEVPYRYSSGKVFYEASTHGVFLSAPTVGASWSVANTTQFLGKVITTSKVGDSFGFYVTGEGFEIMSLANIFGGTALVQINGVDMASVAGVTIVGASGSNVDSAGTGPKIVAITGLPYKTHLVTVTNVTGTLALFGYSVLSVGGRLRNTYNNDSQIFTPVWDSRDFASTNTLIGVAVGDGGSATSAATSSSLSFSANQPSHGFSILTPIYHDGTIWKKAQANNGETLATYVVTKASTDSFTAVKFGILKLTGHGLTVGEFYYVSSATAGAITTQEPTFGFSNPVLYVETIAKIHIMCHRPSAIGDGSVSDSEVSAIVAFPSNVEPAGFLYCDGRAISRTVYGDLFHKIGTKYGAGDGVNTFHIPDMRGWFMRGGVEVATNNFLPAAVTVASSNILLPAHLYRKSGFKIRLATTGALPAPLAINTTYYVIYIDDDNIKVATTLANALAGTAVTLTNTGTGSHSAIQWVSPDESSRYSTGGDISFGGKQDSDFGSHTHLQDAHNHLQDAHNHRTDRVDATAPYGESGSVIAGVIGAANSSQLANLTDIATATNQPATATNQNSGGNETRPNNITVGFFIRYAPKGAIKGQEVPSGIIFNFAGPVANVPNGYLLCDGSSLVRDDYADLFAVIGTSWGSASATTFNLPDGRGLFLRGVDGLANRDSDKATRTAIATGGNTGNNVGSLQLDDNKSHTHIQNSHNHIQDAHAHTSQGATNLSYNSGANTVAYAGGPTAVTVVNSATATNQAATATNQNSGGTESRPKNVYVNYIIKF